MVCKQLCAKKQRPLAAAQSPESRKAGKAAQSTKLARPTKPAQKKAALPRVTKTGHTSGEKKSSSLSDHPGAMHAHPHPVNASQHTLVDLFPFNDETDMLVYRLKLHAPFVSTFVIVECACAYNGSPKPLHAHELLRQMHGGVTWPRSTPLPKDELLADETSVSLHEPRVLVRLVNVSCPKVVLGSKAAALEREDIVRRFITFYIASQLPRTAVVSVSDVDELLDGDLAGQFFGVHRCVRPKMRWYWYSEHCVRLADGKPSRGWSAALMFALDTPWFAQQSSEKAVLRYFNNSQCPSSAHFWGWHFSYFEPTERIVNKLRVFSHSDDPHVRKFLNGGEGSLLEKTRRLVGTCTHLFARDGLKAYEQPYDGKLPSVAGWPRNPAAP